MARSTEGTQRSTERQTGAGENIAAVDRDEVRTHDYQSIEQIKDHCEHAREKMRNRRETQIRFLKFGSWTAGERIFLFIVLLLIAGWIIFGTDISLA